jgi:hypothetical protein
LSKFNWYLSNINVISHKFPENVWDLRSHSIFNLLPNSLYLIIFYYNTVTKLPIYFYTLMRIDALDKNLAKIMLPMLKLDTNYRVHELFLNCIKKINVLIFNNYPLCSISSLGKEWSWWNIFSYSVKKRQLKCAYWRFG